MPESNSRIRLLIADDHRLVRQGIQALLMVAKEIEVVGEARDGIEAVALAHQLQPDIILMDIEMPRLDGLAATRRLIAEGSKSRILVLSMRADEESARQAAQAGAWGYQIKNSDRAELIAAIRSVHRGIRVASPSVATFFSNSPTAPE